MTVSVGLIGAGRMGQTLAYHLARGAPGVKLVAVADADGHQAAEVAERLGVADSCTDPQVLLGRSDIEAVVIATPTRTHVELVCAAAGAGKHIFCEKPLALSLAGCNEAITAVERAGVQLQVGFMRRFDPAYKAAKEKIEAGVIGAPVMFKSIGRDPKRTSLDFARRENSGGLIADMAVHDFDLARWLMSSEVERVHAEGGCLVYPELNEAGDIDNAVINLKFANGAVGNVDVSRNAVYGYDVRTEVLGTKGSLWIGKLQQTPLLVLTIDGITHDTVPHFPQRFAEAYAAEISDFVESIQARRAPGVPGREARAATAISIAATRSLDEGRPVRLSEIY